MCFPWFFFPWCLCCWQDFLILGVLKEFLGVSSVKQGFLGILGGFPWFLGENVAKTQTFEKNPWCLNPKNREKQKHQGKEGQGRAGPLTPSHRRKSCLSKVGIRCLDGCEGVGVSIDQGNMNHASRMWVPTNANKDSGILNPPHEFWREHPSHSPWGSCESNEPSMHRFSCRRRPRCHTPCSCETQSLGPSGKRRKEPLQDPGFREKEKRGRRKGCRQERRRKYNIKLLRNDLIFCTTNVNSTHVMHGGEASHEGVTLVASVATSASSSLSSLISTT